MKTTGTVRRIVGPTYFEGSDFYKSDLHLMIQGEFPYFLNIEFKKEKTELLKGLKENDVVTVHFNVKGREFEDDQGEIKVINSLSGWKLEKLAN